MANPYPILTVALPRTVVHQVASLIAPSLDCERNKPQTPEQMEVVWQLETTLKILENAEQRGLAYNHPQ